VPANRSPVLAADVLAAEVLAADVFAAALATDFEVFPDFVVFPTACPKILVLCGVFCRTRNGRRINLTRIGHYAIGRAKA
jgi:hypothetical protein